jgi:glycine cleavage system regulatory protein
MDSLVVITCVAQDRPGLVESLSATVASHGGNWLESRMSRLGGQFAGILRVRIPAADEDKLLGALRSLEAKGLKLTVQRDVPPQSPAGGHAAELSFVGQDRPGIVRQISEALARANVNVENLETECTSAPMSGETLFNARARVHIPATCDTQALRAELEKIAADLMVDLSLNELSTQ